MRRGGPKRLTGLGTTSWIARVFPAQAAVWRVQRTTITIGVAELAHTSGSITVRNSAYVRLRHLGQSTTGAAGADLGTAEVCRVSLGIVDATHITVTATRAAQNGAIDVTVSVEIAELNQALVKSIQRGTIQAGTPVTITATNPAKTEIDVLGQVGANSGAAFFSNVVQTNSTTLSATAATSLTVGWQAIEWR